ncbi:MAG: M23 family metallopeptidase [Burkholderiales bacterium]|nr:M23 family metallopeptidase [Burkholderiales bacterium]
MASVKTTAMVALVSALAAVGILATLKNRASALPGPAVAAQPIAVSAIVVPKAPLVPKSTPPSEDVRPLAGRRLLMPVQGFEVRKLQDNFNELRGGVRRHEALDIMAPRGTPVVATDDGVITKLFRSVAGGITIYQSDSAQQYIYYYAHLDRYRDGLKEGEVVRRGDVIGYVGSTGNAPASAPHLHFTMFELGPEKKWWRGQAVNPYPYLATR